MWPEALCQGSQLGLAPIRIGSISFTTGKEPVKRDTVPVGNDPLASVRPNWVAMAQSDVSNPV